MIDTVSRITADQVDHANESGRTPVVFIHGLWLLPHSWDRWAAVIFRHALRAGAQDCLTRN
jgi:pimeloyl-ACP methyl ester carboxylesterase